MFGKIAQCRHAYIHPALEYATEIWAQLDQQLQTSSLTNKLPEYYTNRSVLISDN